MPAQLNVIPTPAPTLSNLVITSTIKGIQLKWDVTDDPTHASTEIWHSETNDFGIATKLAEVWDNTYIHVDAPIGITRYYWIRSRNIYGRTDGNVLSGSATPAAVQTTDVAPNAITSVSIFQNSAPATLVTYDVWSNVFLATFPGTGNAFVVDIQHLTNLAISAIGTTGAAYAQGRISVVESPYVNAGTVTVTNGSAVVGGAGTSWLSEVSPGDVFFLASASSSRYTVQSVDSDEQITLSANYAGITGSGKTYYILTASSLAIQISETTDQLEIIGAHAISHKFPFAYRTPVQTQAGRLYDIVLDWAIHRDDASWSISLSSVLKTLILTELKR
jgi:hypothetical protein